jgi:RNA polymerase sigma factor (sigma-70 family)
LTVRQASPAEPDPRWTALAGHRDEVVAKLRRRLGDHADAEDFVQEALIRVGTRADLDPARAVGLLLTTATRLAIDGHRHRQAETRAVALLASHASAPCPEEQVLDRLAVTGIREHVSQLPPRERVVFAKRASGYAPAEAAAALAVSYKAIDRAYAKARAKLQRALGAATCWLVWHVAKRRRIFLRAQGRGVPAAAVVALLVGSMISATQGRAAPRDDGRNSGAPVKVDVGIHPGLTAARIRQGPDRTHGEPTGGASIGRGLHALPKATVAVGPVGRPHVVVAGGAAVRGERRDEDLSTTLTRCLRMGVQLRPSYVGCP